MDVGTLPKCRFEVDNNNEHDVIIVEANYTIGVVTSLKLTDTTYNKNGGIPTPLLELSSRRLR